MNRVPAQRKNQNRAPGLIPLLLNPPAEGRLVRANPHFHQLLHPGALHSHLGLGPPGRGRIHQRHQLILLDCYDNRLRMEQLYRGIRFPITTKSSVPRLLSFSLTSSRAYLPYVLYLACRLALSVCFFVFLSVRFLRELFLWRLLPFTRSCNQPHKGSKFDPLSFRLKTSFMRRAWSFCFLLLTNSMLYGKIIYVVENEFTVAKLADAPDLANATLV